MKIAILVPTINRPEFIERTINYYSSINCPYPIYIGDASSTKIANRTATFLARTKNVDVNYFHWEGKNVSHTIVKLAEMASDVCDYCAFHGDDDYFIPKSLLYCAEFLALNNDYRTAQGRAAVFALDRRGPFGNISFIDDYWGVNELSQSTSTERLFTFQKKYFVSQFSMHRTKEFIYDSTAYLEIEDGLMGELLHCTLFAINGKSKFLDCLYMVRNFHADISHPSPLDWIMQPNWSNNYHKAISRLASSLQENQNISHDEAKRLISVAMKNYIENSLNMGRQSPIFRSGLHKVNGAIPSFIRKIYKNLRSKCIIDPASMQILNSKRSLYYEDFQPIFKSLVSHA